MNLSSIRMMSLNKVEPDSKWYLVVGGNSGIGYETAKLLLDQENCNVIATANRNMEDIKQLANIMKGRLIVKRLDLEDNASCEEVINEIRKLTKRIDGVALCSGVITVESALATKRSTLRRLMEVNCISQICLLQALVRRFMLKYGGSIVGVSRSAVANRNGGRMAYSAAKAALETGLLTIGRELGSRNIRVNVIRPGLTETKLMRESTPRSYIENYGNDLGRVAMPSEVGEMISFLLSPRSSHVNGQTIGVDGGLFG